jgi:hypothetical protein
MGVYITISSDKSLEYSPNNKSYKFKTHLRAPLLLEGTMRIALEEANIACTTSIFRYLWRIHRRKRPLLRRLPPTSRGNWLRVAEVPFYVPIKKTITFMK